MATIGAGQGIKDRLPQALGLIGLGITLWGGAALILRWGQYPGLSVVTGLGLIATAVLLWLRSRPADRLLVEPSTWSLQQDPETYRLQAQFVARNLNPLLEVTLAWVEPRLHLLSKGSTGEIRSRVTVRSAHTDMDPRPDNYWQAYIISPQSSTALEVEIELWGQDLSLLQTCWLELDYVQYGRQQRTPKTAHLIAPLQQQDPLTDPQWRQQGSTQVLPIPTHLLTPSDDWGQVLERYVLPHVQPGDIVAISETAAAVVQGNFRHPTDVKLSGLARTLCYLFPSKTSLSSAYGMQVLIDSSSPWRVTTALILGLLCKLVGIRGVFYALAGEQAALIDDVTGTLPPYDQFLVLGPQNPQQITDQLQAKTGQSIAIVDANDLGGVKILALSPDSESTSSSEVIVAALKRNPAGNSAEQTPIVLIRPKSLSSQPEA